MYDATTRARALAQLETGVSLRRIALQTGINRSTLREWREREGAFAPGLQCPCPRCAGALPALRPYLYVLGQYLGDGCISTMGLTWVLRVASCDSYPGIRAELAESSSARLAHPVHFVGAPGCTDVQCITQQWL